MSARRIALVSCCGEKLGRGAPARQLYRSQLFQKSVRWVEQQGIEWFVLSAKFGLIKPDQPVAPYDYTVRSMTPEQRAAWDLGVAQSLAGWATFYDQDLEVVVLAGEAYCGFAPKVAPFATVEQPLKGMQIGERLSWLTNRIGEGQEELFA